MVEVAVRLTHLLAAIAGGRDDVFENAPGDRIRYAAMGGVIISTAAVAAASATMAVHTGMRMPTPGALAVGLIWGFIIFNLDRLLVVQMMRQTNKKMSLLAAIPRLLLAIVLGAVISTPVVLQIFKPEIDTELLVLQAEKNADYSRATANNPDYAQIPELTKAIATDQSVINKGVSVDVESDPEVKAALVAYNTAQSDYQKAERNVVCEKEGKCGSGRAGAGIAFAEKVQIRDDAERVRNAAQTRLASARTTAQANLVSGQTTAVAAATADRDDKQAKLKDLNRRLDADKAAHEAQTKKDDGLLARLEALSRLSSDRPTLETAHLTLFLLFLALELLPVLMKLLQVLGPETTYDKRATETDNHYADLAQKRRDNDSEKERLRLDADLASEQRRVDQAQDATDDANDAIIATQREVMREVLEAWKHQAVNQTRNDLLHWNGQVSGGADRRAARIYRSRYDDSELPTVPIRIVSSSVPVQRPALDHGDPGEHTN
jgi:hypothetical protein